MFSLLIGLLYRIRGGSFFVFKNGESKYKLFGLDENNTLYFKYGGTTAARLVFWSIPLSLIQFYLFNLSIYWLIYLIPTYYLSLVLFNHGPYQQLKDMNDFMNLTGIGALRGLITAIPLLHINLFYFIGLIVANSLMGLAYYLGYVKKIPLKYFNKDSETCEFYAGLFIGLLFDIVFIIAI